MPEVFQQALYAIVSRICLCGLAVTFALLVIQSKTFRDACAKLLGLWRGMTALGRTVTVLFVSVFVVYASTKTNMPPLRVVRPLSLPRLESPTVTAADIDRGYRQVAVATNEDASFAMPSDATIIGNWHKRGTFGEWMRLDFGDFAFPLGTNGAAYSAFSVFSDGKIRPTPRDAAREIRAVGAPMLAMQGASRFWTAEDADGARLLTWEGFFRDADTNAPVNAQIRLSPNGDFAVRSNAVETAYARICPQDWDGDGLANERDPDPFVWDGDFFGVPNAIPARADTNAYYWLDVCVTGRLDCATIRVTCDGPSDLGDHVVVARTGQACHLPLLAGASYAVESDLPIASAAASCAHAEIWTNSATSLVVELPLELSFTRSEAVGGSFDYMAHTSPVDVAPGLASLAGGCCSCSANGSGFSWSCSDGCACGGQEHAFSVDATWGGYLRRFDWWGRCACYYNDRMAIDEIEDRGVALSLLDASGNEIAWENPVLVGEPVAIRVSVGGAELSASDFIGLFSGRLRLKCWTVDADGVHPIAAAAVPVTATTVEACGMNAFLVSVPAAWLASGRLASNTEDGQPSKTSVDMSDETEGRSTRHDSDQFDVAMTGSLRGRARGVGVGCKAASIPEGAFNVRTVQAAGTGCLAASVAGISSEFVQIQQQADVFYYSGHGFHDSGMLNGVVSPSAVSNHWHDVDTAVFAGCSVLDIGDKENNYAGPSAHAASPGLRWLSASGATTLLGYAYTAPLDSQGSAQIVADWCANRMSLGDVAAWMGANDNRRGRNACAVQRLDDAHVQYWYFKREAGLVFNSYSLTNVIEVMSR